MKKVFQVSELPDIAEAILKDLKTSNDQATVIGLYGDLGAGKTTLTQEIARQLGITQNVISPTYVIMKSYALPATKYDFKKLIHIDAYRLKDARELEVLGWQEIISDPKNLILVEWPERVEKSIPEDHHKIYLAHEEAETRSIQIK